MTIQEWGAIGEVIGGLAVVLTLAYLAVQIRQNNRSLRAAAYQEIVRSTNEWSSLLVEKAELNSLLAKGVTDYTSLQKEEKGQFAHLLYMGLRNFWVAQHLTREGLVPESICESYESAWRFIFRSPKMLDWLTKNEMNLAREVGEEIRRLIATPQAAEADRT